MQNKVNTVTSGLNLDSVDWQIPDSQLTYALNANIQSKDGHTYTYTNDPGNQLCIDFAKIKPGYKILRILPIQAQNRTVVFLQGPDGKSEIGQVTNNSEDCLTVDEVETDCGCPDGKKLSGDVKSAKNPTNECPDGYIKDPITGFCLKTEFVQPIITSKTYGIAACDDADYGTIKPALYDAGYSDGGVGTFTSLTDAWWLSSSSGDPALTYINDIGIKPTTGYVNDTWVTFRQTLCIDETKTYYLALAADNNIKVRLDFAQILEFDVSPSSQFEIQHSTSSPSTVAGRSLFQRLHIFPITLLAGNHTLEIDYINTGADIPSNKKMFACEIYDNTSAEIIAATSESNLTKVFTTKTIKTAGEFVEAQYECPEGYSITTLENCTVGCYRVKETPPTPTKQETCCTYTPILKDDCCEDCCSECIIYLYQADVPSGAEFEIDLEWIDCEGNPQKETFNSPIFGTQKGAQKDSVKITRNPGNYGVTLIGETQINDCEGCKNPSPQNCCLNLSEDYPIYATYRIDQCETRIYFVSKNNPPRYLSLENPLNRDACGKRNDCGGKGFVTKKTCGELKIFPDTCHPDINVVSSTSGGNLLSGLYHFSIAYTDEYGEEITDYFDFTQGFPVGTPGIHESLAYQTSTALSVNIKHKSNVFDFFNLAVCFTKEQTTTYHLIGNYRVAPNNTIVYTGETKGIISQNLPLIRTPYYDKAGIIEKQNDMLMIADLEKEPDYNFQPFANKLKVQWETVSMPAGGKWDYSNPEIAYYFKTWQRDEVIALGIKFKLKTGKYTEVFHIPGRNPKPSDLTPVSFDNLDSFTEEGDCLNTSKSNPKWKVYNTATSGAPVTVPESHATDIEKQYTCAITSHRRGDMGYYESTETYPCNEAIWDKDADGLTLAGKPIRHHKLPDSVKVHIHDGLETKENSPIRSFSDQVTIHPIGIRLDRDVFNNLLNNLDIFNPATQTNVKAKDLICGFELVYGTRVGHKSVVAKGLVYDVGTFVDSKTKERRYYANYPFNDIGRRVDGNGNIQVLQDPYILRSSEWYNKDFRVRIDKDGQVSGGKVDNPDFAQYGFQGKDIQYGHQRFTFHSPDTHFQAPNLGDEIKLETLELGAVHGHFVPVLDHSMTRFMTNFSFLLGSGLAAWLSYKIKEETDISPVSGGTKGSIEISGADYLAIKKMVLDIIEQSVPRVNYAWQYNGVARYGSYMNIPETGHKRRPLNFRAYVPSAIVSFGNNDSAFHNKHRESTVYLKIRDNMAIAQHYPKRVDDTKYIFTQTSTNPKNPDQVVTDRKTRAYYCSIKQTRLAQYGQIQDIRYVSTGYHVTVYKTSDPNVSLMETRYYPMFGGDTFITPFALKRKHAFFNQNLVGKPNDFIFNYQYFPNLGYPIYYTGYDTNLATLSNMIVALLSGAIAFIAVYGAAKAGGIAPAAGLHQALIITLFVAFDAFISDFNGQAVLDDDKVGALGLMQKGMMYLASYGIPVFYVESDVNTHLRHATDDRDGNYYPNVEGEIPDNWLQEKNVPIALDNTYNYDATFSRQTTMNYGPPYNPAYPQLYCETDLFNRVVYSDPSNKTMGGSQDADPQNRRAQTDRWLNYRRGNYYDFPKSGGKLIALNAGDNGKVYARFENTTKVYNAIITLDSTSPLIMEIGNASMFNQKPLDLATSEIGYIGSQHKAYVKTPQGAYWTDAKRGDIYFVGSQSFEEISNKNSANWFNDHLPFQILKDFPEIDTDNPVKGLGIAMTWDERLKKLLVTKLDHRLVEQYRGQVNYVGGKFYYQGNEIELSNPTYFENHSWTAGYSPLANQGKGAWISFYSFLPNHYVSFVNHFQSATKTAIWNHNLSQLTYQTYYGNFYPYIIEYTVNSGGVETILNSVTLIQDILKYYNDYDYYSLGSNNKENLVNFTKAIIYNKEQVSGEINLVPQMLNNAQQKLQYPRVQGGKYYALISKREHKNTFNGFFDMTNNKRNQQPLFSTKWADIKSAFPIDKVINPDAVLTSMGQTKVKMRSTFCRVRLIQDKFNRYKFVNHFNITQINQSTI